MKTEEKAGNAPLRVAMLGSSQVGKSALTVRYLTKRFIGEYRSDTGENIIVINFPLFHYYICLKLLLFVNLD